MIGAGSKIVQGGHKVCLHHWIIADISMKQRCSYLMLQLPVSIFLETGMLKQMLHQRPGYSYMTRVAKKLFIMVIMLKCKHQKFSQEKGVQPSNYLEEKQQFSFLKTKMFKY